MKEEIEDKYKIDNVEEYIGEDGYLETERLVIDDHPGITLKRIRIVQNKSVSSISTYLHLPTSYIENIENGLYEKLPSHVFAKGYLRSYASHLGIDPEIILKLYSKHVQNVQESINETIESAQNEEGIFSPSVESQSKQKINYDRLFVFIPVGIVTVLIVIILAVYFIQNNSDEEIPLPLGVVEPSLDSGEKIKESSITTAGSVAAGVSLEKENIIKNTTKSKPESDLSLHMVFNEECWVEIVTKNSFKYLYSGYKYEGEKLDLEIKEPVVITIGNAYAVKMFIDDKNIPLIKYTKRSSGVAKIHLPIK
jgi:cytoskeleton protein RodZ